MEKEDLLKQIAERAYNVEFGACRNFATYDAVTKIPDFITVGSIIVGILGLVWTEFTVQTVSAVVLVLSVIGLYISRFSDSVEDYKKAGEGLTDCYYKLKTLYIQTKSKNESELSSSYVELDKISEQIKNHYIARQLYFSDIRANYKFFQRDDLAWMDEQLHFGFFRDRVPYTFKAIFWLIVIIAIIRICWLLINVLLAWCSNYFAM